MNTNQQPDDNETKPFWSKIWQPREHNRKSDLINNMGKSLKESKKDQWRKYTSIHSEQHLKKYRIGKHQGMMAYMNTGYKMTDWPSK